MSQLHVTAPAHGVSPIINDAHSQWFAVYTTSCHEKRVATHFSVHGVEHFLPLYRTVSYWKNRCKVEIERPLFPNYLFVHAARTDRARVLSVPGVLSIVGSSREATALPRELIESLRTGLHLRKVEPHPYLVIGERARIIRGPLEGMEGVIVRKKNCLRVVLTLDAIMKSVAVEVEPEDLEPIRRPV